MNTNGTEESAFQRLQEWYYTWGWKMCPVKEVSSVQRCPYRGVPLYDKHAIYGVPPLPTGGGLKLRLGDPLDQSLSPSSACFSALPGNDVVFVCGFWDNSFHCFNTDTGAVGHVRVM